MRDRQRQFALGTCATIALFGARGCYPESGGAAVEPICAGASTRGHGGRGSVASGGLGGELDLGGAAPEEGGAPVTPPLGAAALLRVAQAQAKIANASWRIDAANGPSAPAFGSVSERIPIAPGRHTLSVRVDGRLVTSAPFVASEGAELLAVLAPKTGGGSTLDVLSLPKRATDGATLALVQASMLGSLHADVGADDAQNPDITLAAGEAGPLDGVSLDPTRPSLALVDSGRTTASFSLPRPGVGEFVAAVVLGDPERDANDPNSLRILWIGESTAVVVKPDPVVYLLHASAAHAALDVFAARGNPLLDLQPAIGDACSLDLRPNQTVNLAQLSDNLRFGQLAEARLPPGPTAFQVFLSIPGDADAPSPLHFDLVNTLLPNQRLRDGFSLGCAGAQVEPSGSAQLEVGGEYLMLLPAGRLMADNRGLLIGVRKLSDNHLRVPPLAPHVPLTRITRTPLAEGEFELTVAASSSNEAVRLELGDEDMMLSPASVGGDRWLQSEALHLPAARRVISVVFGDGLRRSVVIDPNPGSRLLVLAAGFHKPPPFTPVTNPRADDIDADGFVASGIDPDTGARLAPNYLPPDGNSELNQDDCPEEPGPVWGCPAPPLTWLVLDMTARPPVLQSLRAE